jgi:hypothetical protein
MNISNQLKVLRWSPAWRFLVCVLLAMFYSVLGGHLSACLMLLISVISIRFSPNKGEVHILIAAVIVLQVVWVVLSFLVYSMELSPLSMTAIRESVVSPEVLAVLSFTAAQFLFILTSLQYDFGRNCRLHVINRPRLRLIALVLMVTTTLVINREIGILEGGYAGNQSGYWSGLPLIFITSASAWILLQKKHSGTYFLTLNLVVAWWLLCGNRSEILILFIFGNFLYLKGISFFQGKHFLQIVICIFLFIFGFLLFTSIGTLRAQGVGAIGSISFIGMFTDIIGGDRLKFQTYGSSIYSAITSIYHAEQTGLIYGESFLGQIINTIPSFVSTPWERYQDVSRNFTEYQIIGGLGFIGEGYLNFGIIGPAVVGVVFVSIVRPAIKNSEKSFLLSWFLVSVCLYSPRFFLYGFVYFYKLLVLFSILFIIKHIFAGVSRSRLHNIPKESQN